MLISVLCRFLLFWVSSSTMSCVRYIYFAVARVVMGCFLFLCAISE